MHIQNTANSVTFKSRVKVSYTEKILCLLTNERDTGVGCPQLVDGYTSVVTIAILCHVGHGEH